MPRTSRTALRAGLAVAGVAALVALFAILRPGGEGSPAAGGGPAGATGSPAGGTPTGGPAGGTATGGPAAPTSPAEGPTQPSPSPGAREVEIEVEDGRVKGPAQVTVDLGERVVLVVEADVADEVHVHGYDLLEEVRPGQRARIAFVADAPGVFEVELEEAGLLLTRVEVRP
jgi:hypothetical protein